MRRLTNDSVLSELSKDAGIIVLRPAEAVVAESEAEVMRAMGEATQKGEAVTPRGGGTSIPSQAVGTGMVLLQERRQVQLLEGGVRCGPSLVKADLNAAMEGAGTWVPPDPSSYLTCTVGGMVSNNSSGTRTLRYGSTIDYVRELRVVLPKEGARTIRTMGLEEALHSDATTRKVASLILDNRKAIEDERPPVTKNSCGYRLERVVHDGLLDLPKLFVGSEGTLGVFTDIEFSAPAKPKARALMVVETSLNELDRVTSLFRALAPSAVELVDKSVFTQTGKEERLKALARTDEQYLVFCEFDGSTGAEVERSLEKASESAIVGHDPIAVTDPGRVAAAWEVRNETLTLAMEVRRGSSVFVPGVEDLVVPPDRLGALVELLTDQFAGRGLPYVSYGHAGDANLHARPLLDPAREADRRALNEMMEECFESVWKMGGSITGEHGDGMLRAEFVRRQYPRTFHIMKEIRELYDPKGLLGPGVKIV